MDRRRLLTAGAYVAPVILTLQARPGLAGFGSMPRSASPASAAPEPTVRGAQHRIGPDGFYRTEYVTGGSSPKEEMP